jgi:hypothetical protein
MGTRGMYKGFWWETQKKGAHWKDLDEGGRIISRWVLEK